MTTLMEVDMLIQFFNLNWEMNVVGLNKPTQSVGLSSTQTLVFETEITKFD